MVTNSGASGHVQEDQWRTASIPFQRLFLREIGITYFDRSFIYRPADFRLPAIARLRVN